MKKNLFSVLFCLGAIGFLNNTAQAQSKLIHYWNFNTPTDSIMYTYMAPFISGIAADYSLIDTSKAKILYYLNAAGPGHDSTYMDYYTPTSTEMDSLVNLRMGAPAGKAIKARNPSDNMELRFYIPSTNYKNLIIKYGSEASSRTSGQLLQNFDYSVDSGATWKTSGLSITADSANLTYGLISVDFGGDTTVNNNPKLVFRIKFSGNTSGYSGNNRFDNVTLEGDTITAATNYYTSVPQVVSVASAYTLYPNPVNNTLTVSSDAEGVKTMIIADAAGKTVFAGLVNGRNFTMNVADYKPGIYFVTIKENTTGAISNLKFIKQ